MTGLTCRLSDGYPCDNGHHIWLRRPRRKGSRRAWGLASLKVVQRSRVVAVEAGEVKTKRRARESRNCSTCESVHGYG